MALGGDAGREMQLWVTWGRPEKSTLLLDFGIPRSNMCSCIRVLKALENRRHVSFLPQFENAHLDIFHRRKNYWAESTGNQPYVLCLFRKVFRSIISRFVLVLSIFV